MSLMCIHTLSYVRGHNFSTGLGESGWGSLAILVTLRGLDDRFPQKF